MSWKRLKIFLPVILGTVGGYLYYTFIGCNGSCAITSSPVNSTLYGSLIGLVLTDWKQIKSIFIRKEKEQ
ncbi:MAG: hypothetical protein WBQ32_06530 [Ignavibacteriaceae bacterium]